jgi:Sec-independent protein translocase protein TatA
MQACEEVRDMPRIGPTELIIVLVIILIIFGGAMGKGIREFRRGQSGDLQSDEPASVGEAKSPRRKRKEKV